MQKKQAYLFILLAILLYPAVYQFVHIFPHQHHSGHAGCSHCVLDHESESIAFKEKNDYSECYVYMHQYSVNEIIKLTTLSYYNGVVITVFDDYLSDSLAEIKSGLYSSRAPPVNTI